MLSATNRNNPLSGFYAITSESLCADGTRLIGGIEAAILGGARLIQYRDKQAPSALRRRQAVLLTNLCRRLGARLIINDDPQLAADIGADGVHLGKTDISIADARALLGAEAVVGVSCGASLERARQAAAQGASYLAFGRFHASLTKPDAPQAALSVLRMAREELRLPLCAIGGITPNNAAPLIAAGADLIAAVEGVFGTSNIRQAAEAYARLFP